MAATKGDIIEKMAKDAGITKVEAKAALESLVAQAYKGGKSKDGFTIPGIGKITKSRRKARKGRNPATGEEIKIAAKTVVKIKTAKACQDGIVPPKK